jgi:hypothetical protein
MCAVSVGLFLNLSIAERAAADAYKSAGSGNWTSSVTWANTTATPTDSGYPGNTATVTDTAIIDNNNTVTIDSTQTIGALGAAHNPGQIDVGDVAGSPGSLTITGGSLYLSADLEVGGVGVIPQPPQRAWSHRAAAWFISLPPI